ncbi:MAG: glycosyltransferase [Kofleriaceae bacterium]|nr:glycosyltransferase [Kofleriaceae bacterium]
MRVSIVTPSFNQAKFIGRTIDSVLSQTGDFELDYRVIDGGSTDDTIEILQSYGNRVNWVSEPDRGQVDAINRGLRAADGDIVAWLNSDDVLLPGALARIVAAFRAHPEIEWVHGRCKIIDEDDREVRRWVSAYKHFRAQRHTLQNFLTENYISQMTVFWRRDIQEELGYLSNAFRYAFDYDLFLRLAHRGDPFYIEEPTACFRWYETSKSGGGYVEQMTETADRGAVSPHATLRTRLFGRAKKVAIIGTYRALALAREAYRRRL